MNERYLIKWAFLSAIIMLLLPWLAVTLIPANAGMAVCFLLFYAVDPLWAICAGIAGARKPVAGWLLPLVVSAFFLIGTWLLFDRGEVAFVLYACIDLLLGYAALLICRFISKQKSSSI